MSGTRSNTVTLTSTEIISGASAIVASPPGDLVRSDSAREGDRVWTLRWQLAGVPSEGGSVKLTIQTTQGDGEGGIATFTRTVLAKCCQRSLVLHGATVTVSAQLVGGSAGGEATVSAALSPGATDALSDLCSAWTPDTTTGTGAGQAVTGPGVLLQMNGALVTGETASPTTPLYLMLFDGTTGPTLGAVPLLALGPVTPGNPFASDFSARPTVYFDTGLYVAWSSTFETYTAPSSGVTSRVDVGTGQ